MQDNISDGRDFLSRLNLALQRACLSRTALAKELGIAKSTITRWGKGSLPRSEVIAKIAKITGVRREWLSAGIGGMDSRIEPIEETMERRPGTLPDDDSVMLADLLDSPPQVLMGWAKELLESKPRAARRLIEAAQAKLEAMVDHAVKQGTGKS